MIGRFARLLRSVQRRPGRTLLVLGLLAVLALGSYLGGRHGWAHYHFRAAQSAAADGRRDFDQAWRHLTRSLELRPDCAATHFLAARTARRGGAYAEANRHLEICERLGGLTADITLERALLRAQRGELDAVLERYLQTCVDRENHPESPLILEALALGYRETCCLGKSRHCLNLWLARQPENLQALSWRAWVCLQLGDLPQALADYRAALALAPEDDALRGQLAELLIHQQAAEEAAGHFEMLRHRQPDNPAVLLGLARCRRHSGQVEEACQLLDQLLAQEPRDARALAERGKMALEAKQAAQAEDWLRRAQQLVPQNPEINYVLAQCLLQLGRQDEAQAFLAKHDHIRKDQKRLSQVVDDVQKTPHDPELRYESGLLCMRLGREPEGLLWFASVLREYPRHRPTREALADHYRRAGNLDVAERHRRIARQN